MENERVVIDGLVYTKAGGFKEINGENLPVYVREQNPAGDDLSHAHAALNAKARAKGFADAEAAMNAIESAMNDTAELAHALAAVRRSMVLPDVVETNRPLLREAASDVLKVPEFVAAQVQALTAKLPHVGPGSPSARLDYFYAELEKRFPKAHNKFSSAPIEPAYLAAIDDAIRDSLFWKTQSEEQSNTHVAGFKEVYRITGIEDTGEYRWKWLLMEIQEFVGDAKRFAFFFDEDQKKPITFNYAYMEGVKQNWNLVQWRKFFDERMG